MKFNWKIGGEAGFGIMTSGMIVAKIATRSGYHIFDYSEYPSLIRGGHNTYEVVISDEPVHASKWEIDLLACLNKTTFELHKHRLHANSYVIYDPDEFTVEGDYKKIPIPFKKIKQEHQIHQQMLNTVAISASLVVLGGDPKTFEEILQKQFERKGHDVVDFNIKLARLGIEYVQASGVQGEKILVHRGDHPPKAIMTGNDAFSIATVGADCKYYAAYPMTPASSVLGTLAGWQYKDGMVVRHSEDEIAVINSALGASFTGVRSSVGTSGGGFALMVEALSYAGIAELPIVVFLSMRPGPATGLPTWTEQGDLLFAVHAGHGEYPKMVFAAGDIDEMIDLTLKSFDMADIYQTPVIILSDKQLSESRRDILKDALDQKLKQYVPQRGKIVRTTAQEDYLRFKDSPDGISEMLIPGQSGQYFQANSYEHIEDSHTTEDDKATKVQKDKRNRKTQTYLQTHFEMPTIYGDLHAAELILISWGSNKGAILEAQKVLQQKQKNIAYIHFTHLYPMQEKKVQELFTQIEGKRKILIENNSHAQFGQLLRMQTGITLEEKLLKYDGRPFWPEEIIAYIETGKTQTILEKLEQNFI